MINRFHLCVCGLLLLLTNPATAQQQRDLFARVNNGLFVVEVTEISSGSKTLIGSGFLLAPANSQSDPAASSPLQLIATNYHVISEHLLHPESYALRVKTADETSIAMRVLAVDIVHDLALLSATDDSVQLTPESWRFSLADSIPRQGDEIISMGNPYDIGISTVPGTYNGLLKKSYLQSIHFTGAVNPGMSGGPAVNSDGSVVGINVAGAGNSVSLLVPVKHLQSLVKNYYLQPARDYPELREQIRQSLHQHQSRVIDDLLARPWELSAFGPLQVPMEIAGFITCTGTASTEEDELRYEYHHSDCGMHDRIFLSSSLDTGPLEFDYGWYRSDDLNQMQFATVMEQMSFSPFNRSGKNDLTSYACRQDILRLEQLGELPLRGTYCVRAYSDYEGLFDVLFYAISLQDKSEAFYLHYTLSGVSKSQAQAFNQRFVEAVAWN